MEPHDQMRIASVTDAHGIECCCRWHCCRVCVLACCVCECACILVCGHARVQNEHTCPFISYAPVVFHECVLQPGLDHVCSNTYAQTRVLKRVCSNTCVRTLLKFQRHSIGFSDCIIMTYAICGCSLVAHLAGGGLS